MPKFYRVEIDLQIATGNLALKKRGTQNDDSAKTGLIIFGVLLALGLVFLVWNLSVNVGQGDLMAPLDVMASTGVMAPLDLEVNGANLGLLGRKESQEIKAPRGYMDGQGHPGKRDHLAQMELKDRQESEESKASRGCMGTQGHLGKTGQLDHEDHQDREDHRDREDHQDCEDCEVRQDLQDRQDHAAVRGGKGLEVDRVRGVDQGKEDSRVREGRRGHRAGIAVTIRHDLVVTVLRVLAAVASISLAVTGMVSHAPGVQGTTT